MTVQANRGLLYFKEIAFRRKCTGFNPFLQSPREIDQNTIFTLNSNPAIISNNKESVEASWTSAGRQSGSAGGNSYFCSIDFQRSVKASYFGLKSADAGNKLL